MKALLIPALLALGLAGCAAAPDLPANYALNEARQEGVAIVSLTLDGKSLDQVESFAYRLREVTPHGTAYASVTHRHDSPRQHARALWEADKDRPFAQDIVVKGLDGGRPLDIRDSGQPVGRVAALRLAPGEYEIHAWPLREPARGGTTEYAPPRDFSYRFSIKPGEAIYLGRIELDFTKRNAQRITVTDRRTEDLALLGKTHAALTAGRIVPAVGSL